MTAFSRPQPGHVLAVDTRVSGGHKSGTVVGSSARLDQKSILRARVPGPQTPGLVSTTTVFAGLLLTLTPFLWANVTDGVWTAAAWNEATIGIALTTLGLARLVYPLPLIVATALGSMLGGWLTLAPLLLDYGLDPESTPATLVDILIGIAVLLVTILGHADGRSRIRAGAATHKGGRPR